MSYSGTLHPTPYQVKILPGQFHDFPTPSHLSATRFWPKMLGLKKPQGELPWNHHEPQLSQLLGIVCRVPPSLDVVEQCWTCIFIEPGKGNCIFFGVSIFLPWISCNGHHSRLQYWWWPQGPKAPIGSNWPFPQHSGLGAMSRVITVGSQASLGCLQSILVGPSHSWNTSYSHSHMVFVHKSNLIRYYPLVN